MNQVPEEKKDSVTKTLAILGFVAIIILIVWLAVKIVAVIPGAFSSLASIADSIYNNNDNKELTVNTKNSVVNAGESFNVSWSKMRGDGTYGFQYKCTEGVSLDIRTGEASMKTVDCGTYVDLEDTTDIDLIINAEKQRFTDVEYGITYNREGAENIVSEEIITIINTTIPTGIVLGDESDPEEAVEETEPTTTVTPVTTTPTPTVTTPTLTAGEPTVITKYIYKVPVSDPNGYVDLQVTHVGVGTVNNNGVFTPLTKLDKDKKGAIRFEIKNIGTKTTDGWSYEAELPSDISFDSNSQKDLKPNERVVITLGFDGITRTGIETFGAEVTAKGDINKANNDYTWKVAVVK